jgi:glucose-1-phosphate thymidylyltransferase
MIKKGIILAGGMGTRMSPLTKAVNKQLLPIYDKPLIFYPLSILMLAKIKDILIIVNKGQLDQYKKLIPNGNNLGIKISYLEQESPRGLPDAFILGEKFIGKDNVALILGDNFFYGQNLSKMLLTCSKLNEGAKVILHKVPKPEQFGVAKINNLNKIIGIKEKPKKFFSNLAITGLYFFDNRVVKYSKLLKPSKRNELEITSLLISYLSDDALSLKKMNRGYAWLDTGTHDSLLDAGNFVRTLEKRQGLQIGSPDITAFENRWISSKDLKLRADKFSKNSYGKNLSRFN